MLITYIQIITNKDYEKNDHFQDEKYEEKDVKPIISY